MMDQITKKRLRFTDHDDLSLLREVLGQNPIDNPAAWNIIQENMLSLTKKHFLVRTLKEHLELLVKLWLKEFKNLKNLSGIEVIQTEKEVLCQNVHELMCGKENQKHQKRNILVSKNKGVKARDRCASTSVDLSQEVGIPDIRPYSYGSVVEASQHLEKKEEIPNEQDYSFFCQSENVEGIENENTQENGPTPLPTMEPPVLTTHSITPKPSRVLAPIRSRKRKANTQRQGLAYLEAYDANQGATKKKEMELEEKRLVLEERKLAIEERKIALLEKQMSTADNHTRMLIELADKKLTAEIDQRQQLADVIQKQDDVIKYFLNKNCG
ncbi:unnamed protein product [Ceutorhynchus assimilis]|uniref:Uncharacterized protein n=1 Tax=Ceutorhynchus assimilis TaxID=467358 RepID=A0A9N9QAS1_9CUCU|nr:unnamed protein product [Ceutorhynchus assimilis]